MTTALAGRPWPEDRVAEGAPAHFSLEPPLGRLDAAVRGRDELLDAIITADGRRAHDVPEVHVFHGLGGSGKTFAALEIARRAKLEGRTVLWVGDRINTSMRAIAVRRGAPSAVVDQAFYGLASAPDLVWDLLNVWDEPWLLIFDNADDPQELAAAGGAVAHGTGWVRLPRRANGFVIVTTRHGTPSTWGTWATLHHVGPLGADHGGAALLDRAGPAAGTLAQAQALAHELGGLPLALKAAGEYLRTVHSSQMWLGFTSVRSFADFGEAVRSRFDGPFGETGADAPESLGLEIVDSVWSLSLDLLAARGLAPARRLFRLLACLPNWPIPYGAILKPRLLATSPLFADLTRSDLRASLQGLADLGLLDNSEVGTVADPALANLCSLHPLIHQGVRNTPHVRQRREEYYDLITRLLVDTTGGVDPDNPADWPSWDVLVPHAGYTAKEYLLADPRGQQAPTSRRAFVLARRTARYLLAIGLPRSAFEIVGPTVEDGRPLALDRDDPLVLAVRHEVARAEHDRGRLAAAEARLREVFAARARVHGPSHPTTLDSRHQLALTIVDQGRWAEAERELRGVMAHADGRWRADEAHVLAVRHTLARAVLDQGRAEEALDLITGVLPAAVARWPTGHPELLAARLTYARCLEALDLAAEAEAELDAIVAAGGHDRQPDRTEILAARRVLARLHLRRGQRDRALAELGSLVVAQRRALGDEHPETLATEAALAELIG